MVTYRTFVHVEATLFLHKIFPSYAYSVAVACLDHRCNARLENIVRSLK